MLEHAKFKSTDGSGSWAAAYLMFTVALVGAALFSGLAYARHPEVPVLVLAIGGAAAMLSLVLRVRPDLPSQSLWLFSRGRQLSKPGYVPRIIKTRPCQFGTNRPPTVDEIRELKDNPRNWVPSRSHSQRRTLRD